MAPILFPPPRSRPDHAAIAARASPVRAPAPAPAQAPRPRPPPIPLGAAVQGHRFPPQLPPASLDAIDALYAAGYWLLARGRADHASAVFRSMVHLSTADERGWLALGACYEAQGHPDLALAVYAAAGKMITFAARCDVARARILRSRGQLREAREALALAAHTAKRLRDEELHAIVAGEWSARSPAPDAPGDPP